MFTEVQGKPLRGILSNVQFNRTVGNCVAIFASSDYCEGQEGRNPSYPNSPWYTSTVEAFDVVEGQLVIITEYSCYIVEGQVGILEVTAERLNKELLEELAQNPTKSMTGLSS